MTTINEGNVVDGMNKLERYVKRLIDLFVAIICLIIFSPLMLICYIAVKHEDGGPAIFKQERIGLYGRPFTIYKFRSMRLDAEKDGPALYQHDNETRMTKVGKFLRDHHLDELPQLWNVVKGDMSFIGPRPERPEIIEQYLAEMPEFAFRMKVKAGLAGYAQVYGKYSTTSATPIFIKYDQASPAMLHCITAIPTRWRKCSDV